MKLLPSLGKAQRLQRRYATKIAIRQPCAYWLRCFTMKSAMM